MLLEVYRRWPHSSDVRYSLALIDLIQLQYCICILIVATLCNFVTVIVIVLVAK